MARYIDADLLLKDISESVVFSVRGSNSPELRGARKIIGRIKEAPTADVAEVVRCKDCKRCFEKRTKRNNQLMRFCMRMDGNEYQVNANDFCSYGERKEG